MLNEARDQSGRPKSTLLAMCSAKKVKKSQKNWPATIRKEEKKQDPLDGERRTEHSCSDAFTGY